MQCSFQEPLNWHDACAYLQQVLCLYGYMGYGSLSSSMLNVNVNLFRTRRYRILHVDVRLRKDARRWPKGRDRPSNRWRPAPTAERLQVETLM